MKLKRSIFLISGILLFNILITDNVYSVKFEVQFHASNLSKRQDLEIFKSIGIERLIIRVFENKAVTRGLFFSNSQFKIIYPYLDLMLSDSYFRSLNLWAWMIVRNFNWVKNDQLFDYEYILGKKRLVKKLDIFNPEVQKKVVTVFEELAKKRVPGILIQDDLFLRYNEGFSNWGKAQFTNSTRLPAKEQMMMKTNSPYNYQWIEIKKEQINKLLRLIVSKCKEIYPDIKIGMNIFYETPVFIKKSESWYGHNLVDILNTGIDYIYLMSYHRQIKKELKLSEENNKKLFANIIRNAHLKCQEKLIVKIQIRDFNTGELIPVPELLGYIELIPPGVNRICFTPVRVGDLYFLKEVVTLIKRKDDEHKKELDVSK